MLVSKVQNINFNYIRNAKYSETSSNNNQVSFGMKYPKGARTLMVFLMLFGASCQNLLSRKIHNLPPAQLQELLLNAKYNHLFPNYGAKNDTLLAARNIITYVSNSIKDTCDVNKIIRTLKERGDSILELDNKSLEGNAYEKAVKAIKQEVSASEKVKP